MIKIDHDKLQALVKGLYATVRELERMFPGRHFTPDGHMVGSLGECLVADAYGLELVTASTKGYDALSPSGLKVEIKATQGKAVAFRSEPEHAVVVKLLPDGSFEEIYNGPGRFIWVQFEGKRLPPNGQFIISLARLRVLSQSVEVETRMPRTV